jgi:hypothetical protein
MKSLVLNIARLVSASLATAALAANGPPPAPPAPVPAAGIADTASTPKIHFDAPVYDFGKVAAGEPIQHTFAVSNAGDATLVISAVRPSCGCTTAGAWTKEIEPGKTGVIPVQINSSYLRGTIEKTVTVASNDKSQPTIMLRMRGNIWKPIEFNPPVAYLHLPSGSPTSTSTAIRISNKTDQALTLSPPESANKFFSGTLKTIEPGKEFELTVASVPPMPTGSVQGSISIKTSVTSMPVLNIPITAIAPQPEVLVMPPSITLAAAASNQTITQSIAIQATAPQPLTLSNAAVNAKGIDVQVKELLPGRRYNLTLTFPQGFQIPPGQELELSVKSNYPQFPVIRVPISQPPASAAVAARKG